MKNIKNKLLIFIFLCSFIILIPTKSYAINRIVYRMTRVSMYEYKVELRWSDNENGNIQIVSMSKNDNGEVEIKYVPYSINNVRETTINTLDLGLEPNAKPHVILVNKDGNFNTLNDISGDYETKKAIFELYQQGIINGYDDGTFKQNNTITKEEFSSMFLGYMNYSLDTSMQSIFSDVKNDRWSKNIIMTLYKNNVITGQDDGSFGWAKNVSLGEVATMIARSKNLQVISGVFNYKHTASFHWANDYISALVTNGLIKDTDTFYTSSSQNLNLTRGQVAVMLNRS